MFFSWDFESDEFSIFGYFSIFGCGFVICIISLTLQIVIPIIIMWATILDWSFDNRKGIEESMRTIFCVTDDEVQCHNLTVSFEVSFLI